MSLEEKVKNNVWKRFFKKSAILGTAFLMPISLALISPSLVPLAGAFTGPIVAGRIAGNWATNRPALEGIVKDGQVTRGWIGVEPNELTPELAQTFGVAAQQGVIITGVLQNGPAAQAGMKPGDVVTKIGDQEIRNVAELLTYVAALKPGTAATFEIQRTQGKTNLQVMPGVRPKARRQAQ